MLALGAPPQLAIDNNAASRSSTGKRRIPLDRYCRQFLHRRTETCEYGAKCKFLHVDYCRSFAFRGQCDEANCIYLHVDICSDFTGRNGICVHKPCKYLHVRNPYRVCSSLATFASIARNLQVVTSSVDLPSFREVDPTEFRQLAIEDQALQGEDEDIAAPLPAFNQFTAGAAAELGYADFVESGVDDDTDGENSEWQTDDDKPVINLLKPRKSRAPSEDPVSDDERPLLQVYPTKKPRRNAQPAVVPKGDYVPKKSKASSSKDGEKSTTCGRISLRNSSKLDADVGHRWVVTCSVCNQIVMRVNNHRIISGGEFKYRALRGFWTKCERTQKLFGRGDPSAPNEARSCQRRLPSDYNVKDFRHRRKEKHTLTGKLLKVQFSQHTVAECRGDASLQRTFKLDREFHGVEKPADPDNDEDN